jgi:hypothetical protein
LQTPSEVVQVADSVLGLAKGCQTPFLAAADVVMMAQIVAEDMSVSECSLHCC